MAHCRSRLSLVKGESALVLGNALLGCAAVGKYLLCDYAGLSDPVIYFLVLSSYGNREFLNTESLEKSYSVLDISSLPFIICCQNKYKDYWAVNFHRVCHIK